jgi:hypothetical protein
MSAFAVLPSCLIDAIFSLSSSSATSACFTFFREDGMPERN